VSWLLAFGGFAALIILHEFGHFAAAKAVGMRVERFALFFPPLLFRVRRGETEYGIGAVPLGGYVKITGMNPAEEIPPEVAPRAYLRQPPWKRIVVIAAGPAMNVLIAFVIIFGLFTIKGEQASSNKIGATERGYPAAAVLHPGDRIVAVDGRRLTPDQIAGAIARHRCAGTPVKGCRATTPVTFTVRGRDGATRTVALRPVYDPGAPGGGRTRVGFGLDVDYEPVGAGQAASDSVTGMWRVTKATVDAVTRIFYDSKARKQVSSVVGSYETTRQSFQADDIVLAMQLLALISLSLAIINLFPFLPLDGGHIFWAVAEKVRGRPIPFRVMEQASYVGFVLVIMLFVVGLTNDIDRLRGSGFGVR
jgi:regulator of sigma E protease